MILYKVDSQDMLDSLKERLENIDYEDMEILRNH